MQLGRPVVQVEALHVDGRELVKDEDEHVEGDEQKHHARLGWFLVQRLS